MKGDVDEDIPCLAAQAGSTAGKKELALPPWSAPVGLPLLFAATAAFISYKEANAVSPAFSLGAAVAGLLLGVAVWACDRPSGRGGRLDVSDQGTLTARFLALVSLLCACLPVLGLIFAAWAVIANQRRTAGWPWFVSRIAVALALLWSGLFVAMYLFSDRKR